MRKHNYICSALLIIWFCFSVASSVEARQQGKKQQGNSPKTNQQTYKECKAAGQQRNFDVILMAAGPNKINVIKIIREVTGLSLRLAKDLIESAPKPVKEGIPGEEAESICKRLTDAGATVKVTKANPR